MQTNIHTQYNFYQCNAISIENIHQNIKFYNLPKLLTILLNSFVISSINNMKIKYTIHFIILKEIKAKQKLEVIILTYLLISHRGFTELTYKIGFKETNIRFYLIISLI